jgi:parallel beta-helix repeat protein
LSNNVVNNNSDEGIYVGGSSGNTLIDNTVNNSSNGIHLSSSSGNSLINNTANGKYIGIYLERASSNNILTGNRANGNRDCGIYLRDYSNNNVLTANAANENERYGIYLNSVPGNITLVSNTANYNHYYGIYLYDSNNNTLVDNSADSNGDSGIYLSSGSNNTLTGNTANNNGDYGIHLSSSSGNTLTGNIVKGNYYGINLYTYSGTYNNNVLSGNTANNNYLGILLSSNSKNHILIDNNANDNNESGIQLEIGYNNVLTGNTANNNRYGIRLDYGSNNTLEDNTAGNNEEDGIHLFLSSNNTLNANTANNNGHGIYMRSRSGNGLRDNTVRDNDYGIYLYSTNNNTLIGNIANDNNIGFYLTSSNYNSIDNNIVCDNNESDFYLVDSLNNGGVENACYLPDGWTDEGTTGCTNPCACEGNETRPCPNQNGVCGGSIDVCTDRLWPGCAYSLIQNYELTETSCDSLDNDCDGKTDEGCRGEIFYEPFEDIEEIQDNGGEITSDLSMEEIGFENGFVGKAAYLSGANNEYTNIKYENFKANSTQGTIEFWYKQRFRWEDIPGGGILEIGHISQPNTLGFFSNVGMNGLILELKKPDWSFSQAWAPLNLVGENEWHYVVGQWKCNSDDNFIKIYLDGKLRDKKTETVCPEFNITGQYLGVGSTGWYGQGGGIFDELWIYDYLKTEDEIEADYEDKKASLIHCHDDDDCGSSLHPGEQYCDADLYKDQEDFSCLNGGTTEARCKSTIVPEKLEECHTSCTQHPSQQQCNGVFHETGFENEEELGSHYVSGSLSFEPGLLGNASLISDLLRFYVKPEYREFHRYDEMTLGFWFRPTEAFSGLDVKSMSPGFLLSIIMGDNLTAKLRIGGSYTTLNYTEEEIPVDRWYYITSTFHNSPEGSYSRIYLDGRRVAELTSDLGTMYGEPIDPLYDKEFNLDFDSDGGVYLDELHIYDYVRSDSEIWQDYANEAGGPICYLNSDCGESGFIDDAFCSDEKTALQLYRNYTCLSPGAQDASCSYEDVNIIVDTCDEREICVLSKCVVQKPESTGKVKVVGRNIYVDDKKFTIKGVGYQPIPIGYNYAYNFYTHPEIYNRDFAILREMGGNTLRTWDKVKTTEFLDAAWNNGDQPLYVVMGYWMDRVGDDFGDPATRQGYIDDFRAYVAEYKDHPAVLMWGIGNEDNYFYQKDVKDWYSLVNEMAKAAYGEEGDSYHPAAIINGGHTNIGDASKNADDAALNYIDIIGAIVYPEGGGDKEDCTFGDWFDEFEVKSEKPTYLAEYGADSWDSRIEEENQDMQARCVAGYTEEMLDADVCLGGTIMEYSDEWWKVGSASSQDPGGWYTSSQPDGMGNEDWWGVVGLKQGSPNIIVKKKAYYELLKLFGGGEPVDADGDGFYSIATGGGDCDDSNPSVHPGRLYWVYYKDSLMVPKWQKLGTIRAQGESTTYVDTSASGAKMRFYVVMAVTHTLQDDSNGDGLPDRWTQVQGVVPGSEGGITLTWPVKPADRPPFDAPGDEVDQNCDGYDGVSPLTLDSDLDGVIDSEDLCPDVFGVCLGCPELECSGCAVVGCSDAGPICNSDDPLCGKIKCPKSGEKDLGKCGKSFVVNYPGYDQMSCVMLDETVGECGGECSYTCGPGDKPASKPTQTSNVNANVNNVNNVNTNVNRNVNTNVNQNVNNYANGRNQL